MWRDVFEFRDCIQHAVERRTVLEDQAHVRRTSLGKIA